ncbi:ABC-F family ATP-binding cassette domain-containing protein [bacterium]|nr:ABC-F family ATP-binding cassette domain-containing protein [bacterium]MBT4251290.1 ABC-F family ATP-binding cassette domain-containing protein [bacterium]MBT4598329.1 ABC-F family ATP-binding cassette domain-containing protein [bacterium]MBT6754162.1 ABC-F family ATP-binding cassette domain-containing protein [bacterium]MBT7037982.1 ABC-F family ATP-binding cassette domain-containing protein [bacterium]
MLLTIKDLSYKHRSGEILFSGLNFSIKKNRTGLVGENGTGKSTLLKIILGDIHPQKGTVNKDGNFLELPQNFAPFANETVSDILGVTAKLRALEKVMEGVGTNKDLLTLDDDWEIKNDTQKLLEKADLGHLDFDRRISSLSGGETSKLFFTSLLTKKPDLALMDEPTNHLDAESREFLYGFIKEYPGKLLIISHDRQLLRLMEEIIEIRKNKAELYGGNFDFYRDQRDKEKKAKMTAFRFAERTYKKSIKKQESTLDAHRKNSKIGAAKAKARNFSKAIINRRKMRAEETFKRLKKVHAKCVDRARDELIRTRAMVIAEGMMHIELQPSQVAKGGDIVNAQTINYQFENGDNLWKKKLTFKITDRDRWHVAGKNGSGKSTLIKLLTKEIDPVVGKIDSCATRIGIIDQNITLLKNDRTILQNIISYAPGDQTDDDLRVQLGRFLFYDNDIHKKVKNLSGGERVRAAFACLLATDIAPDLLILDEPNNNLDLNGITQLTNTLKDYEGTILVISHDRDFIDDIGLGRELTLSKEGVHKTEEVIPTEKSTPRSIAQVAASKEYSAKK